MEPALNRYEWKLRGVTDGPGVRRIAAELDIPAAGARMLFARGVTDAEAARRFLFGEDLRLHDPFRFERMGEAVGAVQRTAAEGQSILVHGDYDVDGISGTALLFQYLDGTVPRVYRYLPDRRGEGYGVSARAVDWAIEHGVGLFIAVDCGTSDAECIRRLERSGIAVIVCDHHELPVDAPTAGILLNPVREGEGYPFRGLCGTAVAFKLVQALEQSGIRGNASAESLLDLVALATVGDLAPLVDENRLLVRLGLDVMNRDPRVGLAALRSVARMEGPEITTSDIGFRLAQRLNAPGRIAHPKPALEILCETDGVRSAKLAARLEADNEQRRDLTERVRQDVARLIEAIEDPSRLPGFVFGSEEWDEGVLGIAASRLVDDYGKPALLMSTAGHIAKGSGRSVPGVHLKSQLDRCKDLLVRYGGHAQAVGFSIETGRVDAFRDALMANLREAAGVLPARPKLDIDGEVTVPECSMELVDFLGVCEPMGFGNPQPVWQLSDVTVLPQTRMVGNGHLKLCVTDRSGNTVEAIAFGFGQRGLGVESLHGRSLDLAVMLHKGFYLQRVYPELRLVDLRNNGR